MRLRTVSLSLFLHIAIAVVLSVGAGWLWKKQEIVMPPPISVEIITVSDKTQTDKKKITKDKPQKKTQQKKAAVKQAKKETPPDQKRPAKAATNKNKTAKTPVKKKDVLDDKTKDEPVVAQKPSNKPPKKEPKKPPKKAKPKPEEDFTSVLKNLAEDQKKTEHHQVLKAPKNPNKDRKDFLSQLDLNDPDDTRAGYDLPLGASLTVSEVDLLRRQLEQCWSVPIGARNAEDLAIDIFMVVNPDRTVHHAKIVDKSRYKSDGFYRAAADSALRAVNHPDCRPLDLPQDKYALWKEIVVTFDPKQMF